MIMVTIKWDTGLTSYYFQSNIIATMERWLKCSWNIWIWDGGWWLMWQMLLKVRLLSQNLGCLGLGRDKGRLKSGVTLTQQGRAVRVWGHVPGTYWELHIWWMKREREKKAEGREEAGYIWGKGKSERTEETGLTTADLRAFWEQLWMAGPETSYPSIMCEEFENFRLMGSELNQPPSPNPSY